MIFVTGGTGLLGGYLLEELVARNKKITAIYRSAIPSGEYAKHINWVKGDILDTVLLQEIMQGVEEVYHCAGYVSFNPRKRKQMMQVNITGTANVVNAALYAGVRKLVHVSSVAALGRKREGDITEQARWTEENNNSNYGRSKFFSELEVWRGIGEGLEAVIVNPVIILGVGDWNEGSAALFKNAWNEFPWYTEGVSGFVDAADAARAMILLMESDIKGERFIISAENRSFREVFSLMAEAFGKKAPHRKVRPYMAALLWRLEKIKTFFTGIDPLLTKETADTGQRKVYFNNSKLRQFLPGFSYKALNQTIEEYCLEYKNRQ
ncbi:MAG: NAD-dependent epimerase/dehydratase family protein [Chitinophagaceae bacterium]|nr:NAD-dependent epimerase/dehydratase family protein [Chitinophagaceae bacterium]MCW5929391.1 NAD-dependent epimerase/dehydratase family protein [Chitinophagaceae bacterium]